MPDTALTKVKLKWTIAYRYDFGVKLIALIPIAFMLSATHASVIDKDGLISKYKGKFVVVKEPGLAIGFCSGLNPEWGDLVHGVINTINTLGEIQLMDRLKCGAEPLQKGEVLAISQVSFRSGQFEFRVENVSPHSIARGLGAFAHQSLERGKAVIKVQAGNSGKEFAVADALLARWLQPFESATEAAKFGNTAAGVFVKQVKAGMSFEQVEEVLGVPLTRVDLGSKILYKYKEMTIEFHEGKVVDVR